MSMKIKKRCLILLFLIIFTSSVCKANYLVNAKQEQVYLGGFTLGFDLSSDGALVVGLSEVVCENGICLPARDAGIKSGDCILSLNGEKITCAQDIDRILKNNKGRFVVAEIISNGEKCIKNLFPQKDINGNYKLGILVRDYLSGLGTVTFVREDGSFYSLGHPIIDEGGNPLKINDGLAYECKVNGVIRGERGRAGELQGCLNKSIPIGRVVKNSNSGLTGVLENKEIYKNNNSYKFGEARPGNAQIFCTIEGNDVQKFDISIIKVDNYDKFNKNLVIRVDDRALIEKTGGIVQGMSGSPIIQNGKLVGAVTHVLINDPTTGYGIFIENMLNAANMPMAKAS